MSLRVTQGMMHSQLYRNINNNLNSMADIQNQSATGRKLNKASDDPVGMTFALRYRSEMSDNSQYQKNVNDAISWLDANDTVLDQAGLVLKRIKELSVQASNGTNEESGLNSIKNELVQLKNQLIDIGNSTFNGKYLFNGENNNTKLFDKSDPAFDAKKVEGDAGSIEYSISTESRINISINADLVFGSKDDAGTGDNIFSVLDRMINAGTNADFSAELNNIETNINRVINARSIVGARTNRLELVQNRLDDSELNLTSMQSKVEDADYAKLLMDAQISENIYQASLSVGAKIIQKSLVDFMR